MELPDVVYAALAAAFLFTLAAASLAGAQTTYQEISDPEGRDRRLPAAAGEAGRHVPGLAAQQ